MKKVTGLTIVSPMYGPRTTTDRMIFSVLHQFRSEANTYSINLVLVDDYIESPGEYDYYLTEEFKKFYDPEFIKITLIRNKEHKYQGESREIGFMAGKYDWFLLIDCDDMLAPNACDRYLYVINDCLSKEKKTKLACVHGYTYGFDTNGYEQKIPGDAIWIQGRCYNRAFILKHGIHFPTGLSSRQSEDYPFIRKFDYALNHDSEYRAIKLPYNENCDCQATAFWFPNPESLSRNDPFYPQHLSGWTMASSNSVLDFFDEYNKKHGFEDSEDEYMKNEYLRVCVYSWYNLLDFIKTISSKGYKPSEEDWYTLRDNVRRLRKRLREKYWDEIIYSHVEDTLWQVRHQTDVHFTESWIGTFYDYMEEEPPILSYSYKQLMDYAKSLKFDAVGHEVHSRQVKAWLKRHNRSLEVE